MKSETPLPLDRGEVVNRYFLEHRAKLIDVAAFLDRVDRAQGDGSEDFRIRSLRAGIAILLDGESDRARRILEILSDPSDTPIDQAPMKGATGAWDGFESNHTGGSD